MPLLTPASGELRRALRRKNTLLLTQLCPYCPGMQRVISGSFNATIARFTLAFSDSPRGFVRVASSERVGG